MNTPAETDRPQSARPGEPLSSLSIVIPAFNEYRRLGATLDHIRDYAQQSGRRCEVIVVDDGSRDATGDVVRQFTPGPLTVRLLRNPRRRGKGFSVRQGMLAATGSLTLMYDADACVPLESLANLEAALRRGADVAIGSRDLPTSRLDPPQPWLRRALAGAFRTVRRMVLLPRIRDTQCGFKLFRVDMAREVFSRQTVNGWLFDCEVLGLAARLGYRITEVGVPWRNDPDTRVAVWREVLTAAPRLVAIAWRLRRIARRGSPGSRT